MNVNERMRRQVTEDHGRSAGERGAELQALLKRQEEAFQLLRRLDRDVDLTRSLCATAEIAVEDVLLMSFIQRFDLAAPEVLSAVEAGELEILDVAFLARFSKEEQALLMDVYDRDASSALGEDEEE